MELKDAAAFNKLSSVQTTDSGGRDPRSRAELRGSVKIENGRRKQL